MNEIIEKITKQEKWLKKFGADNVYNKHCNHLIKGDKYSCKIKMDMQFCSNKCVYATNINGTNEVNNRGKVIGVKKGV